MWCHALVHHTFECEVSWVALSSMRFRWPFENGVFREWYTKQYLDIEWGAKAAVLRVAQHSSYFKLGSVVSAMVVPGYRVRSQSRCVAGRAPVCFSSVESCVIQSCLIKCLSCLSTQLKNACHGTNYWTKACCSTTYCTKAATAQTKTHRRTQPHYVQVRPLRFFWFFDFLIF